MKKAFCSRDTGNVFGAGKYIYGFFTSSFDTLMVEIGINHPTT